MPARARTVTARLVMLMPAQMFRRVPGLLTLKRGAFGVAEFSTRSVSAGSRTTAPGLSVGSVGGLRCVAFLRAVSCESVLSTQVGPPVYGA
jgi:hypothetical protein